MRLFLHKIAVLVVAAGLALSGATSHSHAGMTSSSEDTSSLHEMHQIQHYADLAIDASEDVCLHMAGDAPSQHQHDDGLCKKCCAACTTASLIPDAPFPVLVLSQTRETYAMTRIALVAHAVPTDPGIPKSV
jgi:hypothetical protein